MTLRKQKEPTVTKASLGIYTKLQHPKLSSFTKMLFQSSYFYYDKRKGAYNCSVSFEIYLEVSWSGSNINNAV